MNQDLSVKSIPICIKYLQSPSLKRELFREIASYLNLIAFHTPELLVEYIYYIISAILKGNSCLTRLLYQLCEAKIECVYPLMKLVIKCLKVIEVPNDLIYIFQIMYLISLSHVKVT
jgi:hypothetical protein